MTSAVLQALRSHWLRHPVQLLTLLAGLALATGLWSAVQAINAEARSSYARASDQLGTGQLSELRAPSGFIPLETYVALRRAGWQVSPVLEGSLRLGDRFVTVMGVDLLTYPPLPAVTNASDQNGVAPVDALTGPGRLFVRAELADLLRDVPDLPATITSENVPAGTILTDIGTAETLLSVPGQVSRLVVLPEQPRNIRPLAEIAPNLERHAARGGEDIARLTDSFHLNLTAFGLLSFAVGMFIVHGAISLAFEQRRPMIRTLRALGTPMRLLVLLLVIELLGLALIGGALGLVLGYLVAGALLPDVATTLRGLYGASVDGVLSLRPDWVLAGLAMSVGATLLAAAQATWRLAHMPLLTSPGQQAWTQSASTPRRLAAFGGMLILAGCAAILLLDGLVAGFALLAGLLLGAALMLPGALSIILKLVARQNRSALTDWIWADMRAQLPGLSLALMALLLALAANIGVGTMVSSFRLTFDGWLDQRLASELYITARDDQQGEEIADWLAQRTDAVLPIRAVEMRHREAPLFVYGLVDHATYRDHWPLIAETEDVWDELMAGRAALINEQLARRQNMWPGDTLYLTADWSLPVAGVYSDYGNPTGQALVAMDQLLSHIEQVPNRRFGVRIAPDRVDALVADLQTRFDLSARNMIDQAGVKAQSRAIFEQTFVVTGALNILTLGVAAFAILTSLLTLWTQRLPQIAPVWALGLTRSQLSWLEVLRSVLLAAFTALLALPLGLLLAWVLLAIINVEAFGWRLPMFLFPLDWFWLFLLALIAAALAAALPALRLRRLPTSDLLRVFANER